MFHEHGPRHVAYSRLKKIYELDIAHLQQATLESSRMQEYKILREDPQANLPS